MVRFVILEEGKAIRCQTCGLTSWHPEDVKNRYCGKCHVFHEDAEIVAVTRRNYRPPPVVPGRAAGMEPLWTDKYIRRVRDDEEGE